MENTENTQYIQNITLDLNPNIAAPIVGAKQYDIDSRIFHINLTKDGAEYKIDHNNPVALRVRKPDMHMAFIEATVNYDGTVDVTLSQQCLTAAGRAYADVVEFNATGQMLSTASFIINIQASPDVMGEEAVSSDDFSYLKDTIDSWDRTVAEAQVWANGGTLTEEGHVPETPGTKNNALYFNRRAEAWAKGTMGGEAVPNTDEAYNKHAKYQAETAEAWAVGKRAGATIPSSDPAYNQHAQYWADRSEESWMKFGTATATGDFTGTDEEPSVTLTGDQETGPRNFHFVLPRSNAIYVTFDVDYATGNLIMFRPDVATVQDLTWSVNPTTGNLEVGYTINDN